MERESRGAASAGFDAASVLEHAHVSVIVTDLAGVIVDCNQRAEALYGRTRNELVGADATRYSVDPLEPELLAEIAEDLVTGATWEGEFRVWRADGSVVVVHAIDSPIFGDDGEFRGVVSVALDITARKRVERRLEIQYAVGLVLAEAPSLEDVSQSLLGGIADALGWPVAALWVPSAARAELRCVDIWHDDTVEIVEFEQSSRASALEPGRGLPGRVWTSGKPEWVPDVVVDPNFPRADAADADGLHCALAVPLHSGDELLAVMEFFGNEVEEPDDELLRLMTALGQQIGQFLQRLRAERREQAARTRLEVLARVGELLAVALDIDERLQSVARMLLSDFADLCALWLLAPDGQLRLVTAAHADPDGDAALRARGSQPVDPPVGSPIERALATRQPVITDGAEAAKIGAVLLPDGRGADRDPLELGSTVCIPLFGVDGPHGVLCLGRRPAADGYTAEDVVAGEELARRVDVAIGHTQRFEQQRDAAEVLQRSLLPDRLPEVEFAELASRYVPGSSDLTIGGDWFDAVLAADDRLVLAIGDVAGHGLRAAVAMGRARHAMEFCVSEGLSPGVMLQRMSRFLYGTLEADLVTAAVARLDLPTRELTVASAGHPPILVRGPDGTTTYVQIDNGPPLAVVEEAEYEEVRLPLEPGSVVVLYTDGLVERRGEPLTEGFARLTSAMREAPHHPEQIADHLLDRQLVAGATDDDVAVLVVAIGADTGS